MVSKYDYKKKVITSEEAADILGFKTSHTLIQAINRKGIDIEPAGKGNRRFFSFVDIRDLGNKLNKHYEIPSEFKARIMVDTVEAEEKEELEVCPDVDTVPYTLVHKPMQTDWYETAEKLAWVYGMGVEEYLCMVLDGCRRELAQTVRRQVAEA